MYEIGVRLAEPRSTAVIAARTTWQQWPGLLGELLGEVWACLRAGGVTRGCPNVMVYRDAGPSVDVEVGVELRVPCPLTGRVVASTLPAGRAAVTVHRGLYSELGAAYDAIAAWCDRNGHRRIGIRWEVYGPHRDDPSQLQTEVSWLLAAD
jgi:effector-binding domain-containing protein